MERIGLITKRGCSVLRGLLVQVAWCAVKQRAENPLKRKYEELADRRGKGRAIVAVAWRMLELMWVEAHERRSTGLPIILLGRIKCRLTYNIGDPGQALEGVPGFARQPEGRTRSPQVVPQRREERSWMARNDPDGRAPDIATATLAAPGMPMARYDLLYIPLDIVPFLPYISVMVYTAKISSKGQFTLPAAIRRKWQADVVEAELTADGLLIRPVVSAAGCLARYATAVAPDFSTERRLAGESVHDTPVG